MPIPVREYWWLEPAKRREARAGCLTRVRRASDIPLLAGWREPRPNHGDCGHLDSGRSKHQDVSMRTTLTLEDELARELKRIARQTDRSFKEVVNTTLRQGLSQGPKPEAPLPPFRVRPKACGFRAGVDIYRLNQVSDEIEAEDFQRELRRDLDRRREGEG